MIPKWVYNAEVFGEFSPEEQKQYFNLTRDKYLAEIDNFYYTVFLSEDEDAANIDLLIEDLEKLKAAFDIKSEDKLDFYGFDFYPFGLKGYNYRLSMPEEFDILIRNSLPNDKTPRVWVQIRARYIWLNGCRKCIKQSYKLLKEITDNYGIEILQVQENRVDYCFHNNAIQAPEKFFDRPKLQKHCKTNARIYNLVGNPQDNWSLDYASIGSRNSGSWFFRVYNKGREVVEQNYKSFFIDIWHKNGLINEYDKYCYEYAFKLKSYDVGLLIGQIHWYLKHGKDADLKEQLLEIYDKYFVKNSNSKKIRNAVKYSTGKVISYNDVVYIKKKLNLVLPAVTVITNIEYETHRDFYRSFDKSLLSLKNKKRQQKLSRVLQIYGCRKAFVDHLTTFGNSVAFVKDNTVTRKKFNDDMYLAFWKRLRSTKWNTNYKPELHRTYERELDLERAKRRLVSDAAVLSIHKNGLNLNTATEDFADAFATLNDNDMQKLAFVDVTTGEISEVDYGDYYTVKQRKNRQYRSIVKSSGQEDILI